MPEDSAGRGRAFVLGLDGVPWPLLSDWATDGQLPNFARLFESGATGPLESTTLATTPVAWPSIFTGVNPDQHGIYAFHQLTSSHTRELNTNTNIGQPTLWELLSPSVVVNVPMTYPATEMDGTFVAGMMAPSMDERFTYPDSVADHIQEELPNYEIGLNWTDYHDEREALPGDIADLVAARRDLVRWLMDTTDDWELFFTVFTAPDRLQHLCWDEEILLEHYELLDDLLGEVMDYVDEHDATLYVVSDHGFGPLERRIYPNAVLRDEGLISPKDEENVRGVFDRLGVSRDRVLSGLERVGVDEETLIRVLPESIVHFAGEQLPGDHALYDVDYSETRAVVTAEGLVYVNDTERFDAGIVDPADVPEVKAEVAEILGSLRDPKTGEEVITVRDGDDLYPRDDGSPDLVLDQHSEYTIQTSLSDHYFDDVAEYMASHCSDGIFLAWGDDVAEGARVSDAHVTDVAPTVLHGVGDSVPEHFDGRVLHDVFDPGSVPATTSVRTGTTTSGGDVDGDEQDEDFDGVEERLRGLGYID